MRDKKKLLLLTTIGLISSVTVAFAISNSNYSFNFISQAGVGSVEKTLVMNNATPLEIDGEGKGTVTVGAISAYSPVCSTVVNGVGTLRDMYLYCSAVGLDANDRYHGFDNSTIASLKMRINTHGTQMKLFARWTRIDKTFSNDDSGVYNSIQSSTSNEEQELTWEGSIAFIVSQPDLYKCIHLYTSHANAFDLISLTVEYTCTPQ